MNLILLHADELMGGLAVLTDFRHTHIRKILKSQVGDTLRVGEIGGLIGTATVAHIDKVETRLECVFEESPPDKLPITVILALPRPLVARRALRTLAEMGVSRILLTHSQRVEKSYWQSPQLTPDKIQRYLIEGLEQGVDTVLPEIETFRALRKALESLPTTDDLRLVAHPRHGDTCPQLGGRSAVLAIGPEGGFVPSEVELFEQFGFTFFELGERILKVENALVSSLALLSR